MDLEDGRLARPAERQASIGSSGSSYRGQVGARFTGCRDNSCMFQKTLEPRSLFTLKLASLNWQIGRHHHHRSRRSARFR
jgi:hypothetical protein